jgi:hypothetical protein
MLKDTTDNEHSLLTHKSEVRTLPKMWFAAHIHKCQESSLVIFSRT